MGKPKRAPKFPLPARSATEGEADGCVSNTDHTSISVPAILGADAQGGTNVGIPNLPAPP